MTPAAATVRLMTQPSDAPGRYPGVGEVLVWALPLDTPLDDSAYECLTPDERDRAARYKHEKPRIQFVAARGALRKLLGDALAVPAAALRFGAIGAGKPVLANPTTNLHFNVSHTDGLALIALSERPVGVDVELMRDVSNPTGLVQRFFSTTEARAYAALPDAIRRVGFFRGWTCKEAVIKAMGLSVSCLADFDVELDPARPASLLAARAVPIRTHLWELATWEPAPGYAAAVALCGAGGT